MRYRISIHLDEYDPEGIKRGSELEQEVLTNRTRESALSVFRDLVEILDRENEQAP